MFTRIAAVVLLAAGLSAQQAPTQPPPSRLSSFDRGNSLSMLKMIKEDLTKNYYDPTYHGVDVDKVFAEAAERIKAAANAGEASAILADTLLRLDDSHTKFYPPERLTRVEYGWSAIMIGDAPFVATVKKGSDAERKGLAVGDRILNWNRFEPSRANLWQINYVYRHIRPQQLQRLIVRKPDGSEKTIDIDSDVQQRPAGDLEELIRESEDAYRTAIDFEKAAGDTLVVALARFGDPKEIDRFMKKARGYKNLVLDLRGNGGGLVVAIEMLASWCFDREVTIAVMKTRKKEETERTKGRKDAFAGKIVVLVNSQSASASEVTARLLQIEKRATVIGDRSAGAVMTSLFFQHALGQELGGVGSFAFYGNSITIGDCRMSDGGTLEKVGVTPDETVLPSGADLAAGRDPVLARAITILGGTMTADEAGKFYRQ
jgi:C-terminal processing protease CtpA/Prc